MKCVKKLRRYLARGSVILSGCWAASPVIPTLLLFMEREVRVWLFPFPYWWRTPRWPISSFRCASPVKHITIITEGEIISDGKILSTGEIKIAENKM